MKKQNPILIIGESTITLAEICYGINALSKGARRLQMENSFDKAIQEGFKHRILSFDEDSAHHYGNIMSQRKALGRPLSILDGQIAAIALTHNAILATCNVRDFEHCNLDVIDPF